MFCSKFDATLGILAGAFVAWLAYPSIAKLIAFLLDALHKWNQTAACFGDLLNCIQS